MLHLSRLGFGLVCMQIVAFLRACVLARTLNVAMLLLLQVIYGDTDSIMIHTNSNDYDAAEALGAKVKAAVNR